MNQCWFIGRITYVPVLKYSQSGKSYCNFGFAVPGKGRKGDQSADFLEFVAFGKTAEALCKYGTKGTKLSIHARAFQDVRKVGTTEIKTTKFTVINFEFCESRKSQDDDNYIPTPQFTEEDNVPDGFDDNSDDFFSFS